MNHQNTEQEIRNNVLARIRGGTVHMHSRAYFVARVIAVTALAVLALLLSAFVLSFIIFSIHESGESFLLGFGRNGIVTFLTLFPWLLLATDIAILFVLQWLLQGFKFGYRVSLLGVFLAVFVSSGVLAVLIGLTPVHAALLDRADRGELPLVGRAYESIRESHADRGVFRGTVTSVRGNEIVISHDDGDDDEDDGARTVILPKDNETEFHEGDRAYVFGTDDGEVVEAEGARRFHDEDD